MQRWRAVMVPVALLLAACGGGDGTDPVSAEPVPAPAQPREGVTVEGVGVVRGAPDVAHARVGIEVTRDVVEAATRDANAAAEAVLGALRAHGIDPDDIRTTSVSIRPEHTYLPDRAPQLRGYTVTNMVEVTVRDIDRTGEVLAAVADAGGDATRVEQITFEVDDDEALLAEARAAAFADARRKAEQYATLSGSSLGTIVSIVEGPARRPPMPFAAGAADAVAQESSAVPIAPGTLDVTVHVEVAWSLG